MTNKQLLSQHSSFKSSLKQLHLKEARVKAQVKTFKRHKHALSRAVMEKIADKIGTKDPLVVLKVVMLMLNEVGKSGVKQLRLNAEAKISGKAKPKSKAKAKAKDKKDDADDADDAKSDVDNNEDTDENEDNQTPLDINDNNASIN